MTTSRVVEFSWEDVVHHSALTTENKSRKVYSMITVSARLQSLLEGRVAFCLADCWNPRSICLAAFTSDDESDVDAEWPRSSPCIYEPKSEYLIEALEAVDTPERTERKSSSDPSEQSVAVGKPDGDE